MLFVGFVKRGETVLFAAVSVLNGRSVLCSLKARRFCSHLFLQKLFVSFAEH